jgi:hypothetical protein
MIRSKLESSCAAYYTTFLLLYTLIKVEIIMRWAGHETRKGDITRNAHKILVGKDDGKRPFERPRHRQDNIRMDLREVGWEDMDWMHLDQDMDQWRSVMNTVMTLWVS